MRSHQFDMISSIVAVLCVAAFAEEADAQVWRFLPSDAYFHGSLTRDLVKSFDDKKEEATILLNYSVPAVFDSHLGYNTLEIESVSKRRRKSLAEIYEYIRTREPAIYEIIETEHGEKRKELNGMDLLIYNKSFDCQSYRVGLRYNEKWAAEGSRFARIPREFIAYPTLIEPLPRYVIEDWRNCENVEPLRLKIPFFPGRSERDLQHTAATIASEQIQMIVVPHALLESVRLHKNPSWFFVVQDEKVFRVHRGDDGQSREEFHFHPE